MASAAANVLDTYELLEWILFNLHPWPETLLLSQRVSKQWQRTIQSSKKLQQALFFTPLHVDNGPLMYTTCATGKTLWSLASGLVHKSFKVFEIPFMELLRIEMNGGSYTNSFKEHLPSSYLYPDASWKRMLLTQPPATIALQVHEVGGDDTVQPIDTNRTRIGEIVEWLEQEYHLRGLNYKNSNASREIHFARLINNYQLEEVQALLKATASKVA